VTTPLQPVRIGSRRARFGVGAVAIGALLVVAGATVGRLSEPEAGRNASPKQPSATIAAAGGPKASLSAPCPVSPVVRHGWWHELGGPHAFFHGPTRPYAGPWPYLVTVRFDPDAPNGARVQLWAERVGWPELVDGTFNSPQDMRNIARGAEPAPVLPGGAYLFEQRWPVPGCWRLSAAIDGRVAGSAVIRVVPGAIDIALAGTFMSTTAVDGDPCFAFANDTYSREYPRDVRAWWWEPGGGGDCKTRTSEVIETTATLVQSGGIELVLELPSMRAAGATTGRAEETPRQIRVALYPHNGEYAGVVDSVGNPSVVFTRVTAIQPVLATVEAGQCQPTRPQPSFTAPPPAPAKPPAHYGSDWFGSPELWTMLERDGETWSGLPRSNGFYGQKTFWWSVNWPFNEELEPRITVSGRRLDGPGRFFSEGPGTNAHANFGAAMLIGVGFPTTGCWEITARYKGAVLSYMVLVEE
jgi:hypothetical protein